MTQDAPVVTKRKLIEVALPLDAINAAAAHEKMPGIGPHPRGIHLWWARRPLPTARAVIFAQMVDDPSANPDLFPTEAAQQKERERLFGIIEDLVKWENTANEVVLDRARKEIWQSWRRACAENADHAEADELFDRHVLPAFHDPFAGRDTLPLEAQRLGLEAVASDLNPVAVMINKAVVEIPPKFAGSPPVNPGTRTGDRLMDRAWPGAEGLAEDVRYYGKWIRDEAERRIGHLYPKVLVTEEMTADRTDLERYVGRELTVIAWLWARTVKSPNPAFVDVEVPLASTFILSKKKGKGAWIEPVIEEGGYRFEVRSGTPPESAKNGTKLSRGSFRCLFSDTPMSYAYIDDEANEGRMGARMVAVVAEGDRERIYLRSTREMERVAQSAEPTWKPTLASRGTWASNAQGRRYGFYTFGDYFTDRQLVALTALSDLVSEAREQVRLDAVAAGLPDDGVPLQYGGLSATAYGQALSLYLQFVLDRVTDFSNTCARWVAGNEKAMGVLGKQAVAMTWDYPEVAVLNDVVGGFGPATDYVADCIETLVGTIPGAALMQNATNSDLSTGRVVSTDPPYYSNIAYADLSDFFYVWIRRALRDVYPDIFSTLGVPKDDELIASKHRHGSESEAEKFFVDGMGVALENLGQRLHPEFPMTIYYAFKQAEMKGEGLRVSTGWETFLDAVIRAGLSILGTWPVRTEQRHRLIGLGANALASSIVLVCRPRPSDTATATRREFQDRLRTDFPDDLVHLQRSNIAPVDLAQASIGPGMRIFTEYREVLNADGSAMTVREALALINATLDEVLAEQEGDFDADSRWALTWFEQHGFDEGEFGDAEQLSKAKNTSPDGLVQAGVIESRRGKVRLYRPSELAEDWDAASDSRLTVWEMTHHLIRLLVSDGEPAAAELAAALGAQAETARDLAYRLYVLSDRKKRAEDARQYNALVQSWSEIMRLAQLPSETARQAGLEFAEE